jgi:hypothetical protein
MSTSLPQTVSGLTPFTRYAVRMLVVNEVGLGLSPAVDTTTLEAGLSP